MISELKLSNFRCFDDEVTLRVRPITVILGKNNAGKSSLIKFLLMLKQSVNLSDNVYLNPNGEEVRLGAINELRNFGIREPRLEFEVQVQMRGLSPADFMKDILKKQNKEISGDPFYSAGASLIYGKNLSSGQESFVAGDASGSVIEDKQNITPNMHFLGEEFTAAQQQKREVFWTVASIVKGALSKVTHLSAGRKELEKEVDRFYSETGYVGKNGENTIQELWKSNLHETGELKKLLLRHTESIIGIKDMEFSGGKHFVSCQATYKKTNAKINIGNFGFGVSQCMPIFVQGLLMNPYSQLLVEQPEAQVHPSAQLEMGSFFVDLWNKRQVGSIIETHSANLLLRLQHEIQKEKLKPEDISVAFLDIDNEAVIKNLNIEKDGTLKGIPLEFFDQKFLEMIGQLKSRN